MDNPQMTPVIEQYPEISGFRKKKALIIVVVLLVLGIAGGLLFFVFSGQKSNGRLGSGSKDPEVRAPREDPIPFDRDRDGLSNEEEDAAGTSQTEFDTDRDGLADIDEIRVWKTDPKNTDTDGDGFGDGAEVVRGYNPAGAGKLER